jgi:hypothetical protein
MQVIVTSARHSGASGGKWLEIQVFRTNRHG